MPRSNSTQWASASTVRMLVLCLEGQTFSQIKSRRGQIITCLQKPKKWITMFDHSSILVPMALNSRHLDKLGWMLRPFSQNVLLKQTMIKMWLHLESDVEQVSIRRLLLGSVTSVLVRSLKGHRLQRKVAVLNFPWQIFLEPIKDSISDKTLSSHMIQGHSQINSHLITEMRV